MTMTTEDKVLRAGEAKMLLGHPLLKGAFEELENTIVQGIKNNPLDRDDLRDKYCIYLKVIEDVKEDLQEHLESGKIANRYQEDIEDGS